MSVCNICDQLVTQVKRIGNELQSVLDKLDNQLKNNADHAKPETPQWICDKCDRSVRNRYLLKIQQEASRQSQQMELDNEKLKKRINQLQLSGIKISITTGKQQIKDSVDIKNSPTGTTQKSTVLISNVGSAMGYSKSSHAPINVKNNNMMLLGQATSFNSNLQLRLVTKENSLQQSSNSLTKIICQSKNIITNTVSATVPKQTSSDCDFTMTNTNETSLSSFDESSNYSSDLSCSTDDSASDNSNDNQFISAENTFDESLKPRNNQLSVTNINDYYEKDDKNYYVCKLCTARFPARFKCTRHIRRVHIGFKFVCHLCDKRFLRTDYIRNHYIRKHLMEPPSIATDTAAAQQYKKKRKQHSMPFSLDTETSDKLKQFYSIANDCYICQLCPRDACYICKTRNSIDQHLGIDHLSLIFACKLCDMKYRSKNSLRVHMRAKHCTVKQKQILNAEVSNYTAETQMNSAGICYIQTATAADLQNDCNLIAKAEWDEEQNLNEYILPDNVAPFENAVALPLTEYQTFKQEESNNDNAKAHGRSVNDLNIIDQKVVLKEEKQLNDDFIMQLDKNIADLVKDECSIVNSGSIRDQLSNFSQNSSSSSEHHVHNSLTEDAEMPLTEDAEMPLTQNVEVQLTEDVKIQLTEDIEDFQLIATPTACLFTTSDISANSVSQDYLANSKEINGKFMCSLCSNADTNNFLYTKHNLLIHLKEKHFPNSKSIRKNNAILRKQIAFVIKKLGNEYFCTLCPTNGDKQRFTSFKHKAVARHVLYHHLQTHQCQQCAKVFGSKFNLKRHLEQKIPCTVANISNTLENNDLQKEKTHRKKLHKCKNCGIIFTKKCYLKRHSSTVCNNNKATAIENGQNHRSGISNYETTIAEDISAITEYNKQLVNKSNSSMLNAMNFCHPITASKHMAEEQMLLNQSSSLIQIKNSAATTTTTTTHLNSNSHKCPDCGRIFTRNDYLAHNKSTCTLLGKCLSSDAGPHSEKIQNLHSSSENNRPYNNNNNNEINECHSVFASASTESLQNHDEIFKKYKLFYKKVADTYNCIKCPKTYKRMDSMKQHIKSYHMNCKYFCELCSSTYFHIADLRRHYTMQHSGTEPPNLSTAKKIFVPIDEQKNSKSLQPIAK